MRVITIPCRKDNFSYLISVAPGERIFGSFQPDEVVAVDPCDAEPVERVLSERGLRLVGILNTHHHPDHVGGNLELLENYPGIPVYAHVSDRGRIPGQTHDLDEGDQLQAAGLRFRVLHVPGHTTGHIAYVTDAAAFVGDTVFAAGCGRLFEGTPEMMNESINHKLATLPGDTKLYFAHEYTEANLRFALDVEPGNPLIRERAAQVRQLRARGRWTTPTTVLEEQRTNPFFRVSEPAVIERFRSRLRGDTSEASVFGAVRRAKDAF